MTDQDFHKKVATHMTEATTHMAVNNQRWEAIAGMVSEIRSGTMCPVGIKIVAEVEALKTSERDQWTEIGKLRDSLKYAAMVVAGAGAIAGIATVGRQIARLL